MILVLLNQEMEYSKFFFDLRNQTPGAMQQINPQPNSRNTQCSFQRAAVEKSFPNTCLTLGERGLSNLMRVAPSSTSS